MVHVGARVQPRQDAQHFESAQVADDAHFEQAIVGFGVRHNAHTAAVGREVADGHHEHP
jgi:hypothetical protein